MCYFAAAVAAFSSAASAEGLDRDTMLTDATAVPAVGTVRLTGAGVATQNTDNGATPTGSSSFTGSIGWTPIANLHGDVGAYFQFFSSRRRHTIFDCDWSSDVCSSD